MPPIFLVGADAAREDLLFEHLDDFICFGRCCCSRILGLAAFNNCWILDEFALLIANHSFTFRFWAILLIKTIVSLCGCNICITCLSLDLNDGFGS